MNVFEYLASALLLIVGLGITRLLHDAVDLFRRRERIQLHWVPLAWVALVFMFQIQFVWAIFELSGLLEVWTAADFLLLLALALLLFVSGALVVPHVSSHESPDSWVQFQEDGRWSLAFLATYFLLAVLVNPVLFGVSIFILPNVQQFVLAILLILLLFRKEERTWAWGTAILAILSVMFAFYASPTMY